MALLRKLTGEQKRSVAHWAMELVVVIAGVLIALWVQQWADDRQAHRNMLAAENAIHAEVREALTTLIWREAISRCHVERAQKLKSMLSEKRRDWPGLNEDALLQNRLSEATGIELVVPGVYQRPYDAIRSTAWNSALTTGALTPMDPKRFADLNAVYTQLQFLTRNAEREDRAAAVLSALSVPQELTPETRTRMFQALYEIDTARFMFRLVGASALADSMKALGWNDRAEIDQYIADGRADDKKLGRKWRPCIQPERNPFAASS